MGPDSTNVVTLANSIIGVGILAMPFCFQKCGILLSIVLLLLSNFVTRLSCHYLAKASILSRRRNYEYLAFYAFGPSGKLMVELCIIGYLFGSSVAYHVVVGDLGPQMISQIFNVTNSDNLRLWVLVLMTALVIFPLGLLKNIDSLSVVCSASIAFYFCFVLKVIGESKEPLMSGDWKEHVNWWQPSGLLQCLPIFSMALSCQMQLFEVSETMPGISLDRMNQEVKSATWICTVVYILVGFFGYVAFCTQEFSGNILVNLSQSLSSDIIKIGFVISIAFSFPLVIFPCRASLYSLLHRHGHMEANPFIPESKFRALTGVIVFCSLLAGLVIPSVELVIGLVGSTIGIAICIVFPSCCFTKVSKKDSTEKLLAKFLIVCGFCLMVLGTYANLSAIDNKAAAVHVVQVVPEHNDNLVVNNLDTLHEINLKHENVPLLGSEGDPKEFSKLEYKVEKEKEKLINAELEAKKLIETLEKKLEDHEEAKIKSKEEKEKVENKELIEEKKAENEKDKEKEEQKNPLNNDAIKKEEEEERTADKDTKVVVQGELNAVVDKIKRQNEESQKRVLEKLEEIVEKIEQKLEVEKEVEPRPLDTNVVNQVKDMYPDPIPLRGLNNNGVDPVKETKLDEEKVDLLKEEKQEEKKLEVKEKMDIILNLINKTKEQEIMEEVEKKIELNDIKERVEEIAKKINNLSEKQEEKREETIEAEKENKVQKENGDNKVEEKGEVKKDLVDKKDEEEKKREEDDAEAIRRDLLNVDNESESLVRLKRNAADCEKEI